MKRILGKTSIIAGTILAIMVILIGCSGTENKKEKDSNIQTTTNKPVVLNTPPECKQGHALFYYSFCDAGNFEL